PRTVGTAARQQSTPARLAQARSTTGGASAQQRSRHRRSKSANPVYSSEASLALSRRVQSPRLVQTQPALGRGPCLRPPTRARAPGVKALETRTGARTLAYTRHSSSICSRNRLITGWRSEGLTYLLTPAATHQRAVMCDGPKAVSRCYWQPLAGRSCSHRD